MIPSVYIYRYPKIVEYMYIEFKGLLRKGRELIWGWLRM